MSKIEEIRKRHQERQAGEEPTDYSLAFEEAHKDRATLLAALDGEWQSEPPREGDLWCAIHPSRRKFDLGPYAVTVRCGELWMDGEYVCPINHSDLTGALWQRRTVPGDPFAKGVTQ